jgi:hypothetical protein
MCALVDFATQLTALLGFFTVGWSLLNVGPEKRLAALHDSRVVFVFGAAVHVQRNGWVVFTFSGSMPSSSVMLVRRNLPLFTVCKIAPLLNFCWSAQEV